MALCLPTILSAKLPRYGIRDAHLENILDRLCEPIIKAADMQIGSVQCHIVNATGINAFVTGGSHIFLHSGLIEMLEEPTQLQGVIAHEMGHVEGAHLVRGRQDIENAFWQSLLTGLLAGSAAIAGGGGTQAAVGAVAIGQQHSLLQRQKYSRTHEAAADQSALRFLEIAKISPRGFNDVLHMLAQQQQGLLVEQPELSYISSHPLSYQRLQFIQRQAKQSAFWDKAASKREQDDFHILQAKLTAFLRSPDYVLTQYRDDDDRPHARMARAVAWQRKGNWRQAVAILQDMPAFRSDDAAYWYELKGQLLLESSQITDALEAYRQALQYDNQTPILLYSAAKAMMESTDPKDWQQAVLLLNRALLREDYFPDSWRILSSLYQKQSEYDLAQMAGSRYLLLQGNYHVARRQAKDVLDKLPKHTLSWFRARETVDRASILLRDCQQSPGKCIE